MIDCPSFDTCEAPLCPLDANRDERVWFSHEPICKGRAGSGVQFVITQRKMVAKKKKPGFFTVPMLDRRIRVTDAMVGIDPDYEKAELEKKINRWMELRPGLSAAALEQMRERGRVLAQTP